MDIKPITRLVFDIDQLMRDYPSQIYDHKKRRFLK